MSFNFASNNGYKTSYARTWNLRDTGKLVNDLALLVPPSSLSSAYNYAPGGFYYGCFQYYFSYSGQNQGLTVGFPAAMPWFSKLVEEWNDTFKNIKLDYLGEKYRVHLIPGSYNSLWVYSTDKTPPSQKVWELEKAVVRIKLPKFNTHTLFYYDEYPSKPVSTRKLVNYLVTVFLRMATITEEFSIPSWVEEPEPSSPIDWLLALNNNGKHGYRKLTESDSGYIVSREQLLKLDDYGNVNRAEIDGYTNQTSVFFKMTGEN